MGIRCQVDVQGQFKGRAAGAVRDLVQWSLGAVIPWFLSQLRKDYVNWSTGKPRESQNVDVAKVAKDMVSGAIGKIPDGVVEVGRQDRNAKAREGSRTDGKSRA